MNNKLIVIFVIGLLFFGGLPNASGIYSGNYRIDNLAIDAGGGESSGVQYRMESGGVNQQGIGACSSEFHRFEGGILPAATGTGAPIISTILSPASGDRLYGESFTITGSAASPNGIAFVGVSTDGGITWTQATGTEAWSYNWTLPSVGTYSIRSRATDLHNNVEAPSAGVSIDVVHAFQLNLSVNAVGGGTVSSDPSAALYPSGQNVRLTAAANQGYIFTGWSGVVTDPAANPTDITMDSDKAVTANFVAIDGMSLSFTQNAKTVTLDAKGCRGGMPLSGKKFKLYMSTYDAAYSAWSAWTLIGSTTSDANGEATKSFTMYKGKYRFKAAFEPYGAPKVVSPRTSDCIIAPVAVLSPAAGTVTPDSTPAFSWKAFAGATGYVIQTCPDQYFSAGVSETDMGNVTTADLPALTRGVKTFWRVIAVLPTGRSMPSAPRDITYRENTSLTGLSVGAAGITMQPSATLSGVDSGLPLSGKTVYFYYKKTTATTWQSAGSAVTNASGFAQLAAPKTLSEDYYNLKATFQGDAEYSSQKATGAFHLISGVY